VVGATGLKNQDRMPDGATENWSSKRNQVPGVITGSGILS
jgi:hypothetical protein